MRLGVGSWGLKTGAWRLEARGWSGTFEVRLGNRLRTGRWKELKEQSFDLCPTMLVNGDFQDIHFILVLLCIE